METIETINYKGHIIEICPDNDSESPREWDNLTEFHCWHKRYNIGDTNYTDVDSVNNMLDEAKINGDLVYPLYCYEHGNIVLSLSNAQYPFNDRWDAGQIGFVIVRKKALFDNYGGKYLTKKLKEKAYKMAQGEVETYNQWGNGEVYGYMIDNGDGDSCWGFFGLDYCIDEAKSIIDWMVNDNHKRHFAQLKGWIRNNTPLIYRTPLID